METTMFGFHTAMAAQVFAGVVSAFLILFAAEKTGAAKRFGTWIGGVALVSVLFSIGCTTYYGIAYWRQGVFSPKTVAAAMTTSQPGMMGMQGMMNQDMRGMMERMWVCREAGNDFGHCFEKEMPSH